MKAALSQPVLRLAMLIFGLSASAAAQNITFQDPALEALVRSALDKPTGLINASDMRTLQFFNGCCAGITNLTGLQAATSLTNLDLSQNRIANITPLAAITNLSWLDLGGNVISNAQPLALLTNLTSLRLYGNPLGDLLPLQNLTQLKILVLYSCGISDVTPLISLTNLTYLELRWNPLTNPAPVLSVFTNLKELYLGGTSLHETDFLQNLTQLQFLNLDHNELGAMPPLDALTNLTGLDVGYNPLGYNPLLSIAPIASGANLSSLYVSGDGVDDLSALANLTALKIFAATRNRVMSLLELETLPALSQVNVCLNHLDISSNSPAMTVIGHLIDRNVNVLYLPQDQPPSVTAQTNWTVAAGLPSSMDFSITDDLTPEDQLTITATPSDSPVINEAGIVLSGVQSIRRLTVTPTAGQTGTATIILTVTDDGGLQTNCVITLNVITPEYVTIPDLSLEKAIRSQLGKSSGGITKLDLEQLTYLAVFDSAVTNLTGLEWATNLTTLFLGGNDFTDISPIQNLVSLRYLGLDDNPLSNISVLAGLTNLLMLYLDEDFITDLTPILNLPHLALAELQWNMLDVANPNSQDLPAIQSLQQRNVLVHYLPQRGPPSFVSTTNWIISPISTAILFLYVSSGGPDPEPLTVVGHSSNTNLLPDSKFTIFRETQFFWSLTLNSSLGQTGVTTITFTATNYAGFGAQHSVLVTVTSPLLLDGEAVNAPGLTWQSSPSVPWFSQSAVSHDGISALQSAPLANGQESWTLATMTGPGTLSFWWKVSSETNRDYLEYEIDGKLQPLNLSGEVDWQQRTIPIPFGTHAVRWLYSKDPECCSNGIDAAWLDQVVFTPANWLECEKSTNGQPIITLHTRPGTLHQLQASTNLSTWTPFAILAATNATARFADVIPISNRRFYRSIELPPSAVRLDAAMLSNQIQLLIQSPPGCRLDVQKSTDLKSWTRTTTITNVLGVYDYRESPGSASRSFYRAVVIP